jgi:hypothetical protein
MLPILRNYRISTEHARNIAVAGPVSLEGLGDALQYYVMVSLCNEIFDKANITFICPIKERIYVFKGLKINAHLINTDLSGDMLEYLVRFSIPHKNNKRLKININDEQIDKINTIAKIIQIISNNNDPYLAYTCKYILSKYIISPVAKSLFSFDAGIFAGHTICNPLNSYIVRYETFRSIVKGPMLTSPISLSRLIIDKQKPWILNRLKQSLQKFDFIYVRGPHSLEILKTDLNVDEERVGMALDNGFGIKLICPNIITSKALGRKVTRIVIIPRKDYFYKYNEEGLYKSYLNALIGIILWLPRNLDAEVFLASQTVDNGRMSDQAAIDDVLRLLKKRSNNQYFKYLNIIKPSNFIDAYKLYTSADLVISSRMHGGIMALSAGVPSVFIIPSADVKVLDILSFLGLDIGSYLIDMFDAKALNTENFINRVENITRNIEYHRKIVESVVNKYLPTVQLPVRTLAKLLR